MFYINKLNLYQKYQKGCQMVKRAIIQIFVEMQTQQCTLSEAFTHNLSSPRLENIIENLGLEIVLGAPKRPFY